VIILRHIYIYGSLQITKEMVDISIHLYNLTGMPNHRERKKVEKVIDRYKDKIESTLKRSQY